MPTKNTLTVVPALAGTTPRTDYPPVNRVTAPYYRDGAWRYMDNVAEYDLIPEIVHTIDAASRTMSSTTFRSQYATTDAIKRSGGTWTKTNTVIAGNAGNGFMADGYFYDNAGNQFSLNEEPTPERFGANGVEDSVAFNYATANGTRTAILTDAIEYTIGATLTQNAISLHANEKATINGFNGRGFQLSGNIIFTGDITFIGFEGPTREAQGTLYTTGVAAITPGSIVDYITVGKGVKFKQCRNGIRWVQSDTDDYNVDATGELKYGRFDASSEDMGQGALLIRIGKVGSFTAHNTVHKNTIGDGREICPMQVYIDGQGHTSPLNNQHGNIIFTGNIIDTVINRTTTGDSTPGNNYECCGLRASGHDVTIDNNIIKNVTGVVEDCEGIYVKSVRTAVNNNKFYNAGAQEGAINIKGADDVAFGTNPPGDKSTVTNNTVMFDEYEYTHTAQAITVFMKRVGINFDVPKGGTFSGNKVFGANEYDYRVTGIPNSDNSGCTCTNNESHDSKSSAICEIRSVCKGLNFTNLKIYNPQPGVQTGIQPDDRDFSAIIIPAYTDRGNEHKNYDFSGGFIQMNETVMAAARNVAAIRIEGGTNAKSFDGIKCDDWTWDVTTPALKRPILLTGTTPNDGTNNVAKRFRARNWDFVTDLNRHPFDASNFIFESVDIDLKYRWYLGGAVTRNPFIIKFEDDTSTELNFNVRFVRSGGFIESIKRYALLGTTSAVTTVITETETRAGNEPTVSSALEIAANQMTAKITGPTPGAGMAHVHMQLESLES